MVPSIPVIDLFSDAPVGNPKASAYLLASYGWFSAGAVFLCVVDPKRRRGAPGHYFSRGQCAAKRPADVSSPHIACLGDDHAASRREACRPYVFFEPIGF
jgi:hypothetical protein